MIEAIVPLKSLALAKARLASQLDDTDRQALVSAMAQDVVAQLVRHPNIDVVSVVLGDGWDVSLFDGDSLRALWEREWHGRDLNSALVGAIERSTAERLLLVHGDLPWLGAADLDEVLQAGESVDVVLCPDRLQEGTNLVSFARVCGFSPQFGTASRSRHIEAAHALGLTCAELQLPGTSSDVDTEEDMATLAAESSGLGPAVVAWLGRHSGARASGESA
jgi:2-phospho-L-lactate guanylyltransferase